MWSVAHTTTEHKCAIYMEAIAKKTIFAAEADLFRDITKMVEKEILNGKHIKQRI